MSASFELEIAKARQGAAEATKTAESFRRDIAKANEQAALAEQRAAAANLELAKIKTPRTLSLESENECQKNLKFLLGTNLMSH